MTHFPGGSRLHQILLALCLASIPLGLALLLPSPIAHASTLTVTNNGDSGAGSLRQAILDANAFGGDTIAFSLTLPATITLASELDITKSLTISGPNASSLTISGNNATRVISVTSGITLNLYSVTLANGSVSSAGGAGIYNNGRVNISNTVLYNNTSTSFGGGGIYNSGSLALTNSSLYNNTATINAGGIYNSGTLVLAGGAVYGNTAAAAGGISNAGTLVLTDTSVYSNTANSDVGGGILNNSIMTVTKSAVYGNQSNSFGGGIYNSGTLVVTGGAVYNNAASSSGGGGFYNIGTLTLSNTSIYANTADSGGGINNTGTLTLTNSTLSGNTAASTAGGIYTHDSGAITLINVTLASNIAGAIGGVYNFSGTATLYNTIVANNTGTPGDCAGTITNSGNNLDDGATCGWGSTSGSMSNTNPRLGPLANNGGSTLTMALLPGSPAIDGVTFNPPNGCLSTDQRGAHRPIGPRCDIGAFEALLRLMLPLIQK